MVLRHPDSGETPQVGWKQGNHRIRVNSEMLSVPVSFEIKANGSPRNQYVGAAPIGQYAVPLYVASHAPNSTANSGFLQRVNTSLLLVRVETLITVRRPTSTRCQHAHATPSRPGWLDLFNLPVLSAGCSGLFRVPDPRVSCFTLGRDQTDDLTSPRA